MHKSSVIIPILALLFACTDNPVPGGIMPCNLRCEYRTDPMGINTPEPRFSWEFSSDLRAQVQTAYEILVSENPGDLDRDRGTMWKSGMVESEDNIQAAYEGKPLQAATRYYWKVRTWDGAGNPSPFSEPAWFETALPENDWAANWIWDGREAPETEAGMYQDIPVPLFRKEFMPSRMFAGALP